jgi:hypothetical protein
MVVTVGADHFFGTKAGEHFGGMIPVEDPPFSIDEVDTLGKVVKHLFVKFETEIHKLRTPSLSDSSRTGRRCQLISS